MGLGVGCVVLYYVSPLCLDFVGSDLDLVWIMVSVEM